MPKEIKYNLLLILEGNEEKFFFEIVKELGTSNKINLNLINARGGANIAPIFQDYISDERYDCVLCVYDVDFQQNNKNSTYIRIRKDLASIVGPINVNKISICTNPNILQMFLLCCDTIEKVQLKSSSKNKNTPLVHEYWEKIGKNSSTEYKAKLWQLEIIKNSFLYESNLYNYFNIFENAKNLSKNYEIANKPGSNMLPLLIALKDGDIKFFIEKNLFTDN